MTEEIPERDPERYKFPEGYFEQLRELQGEDMGNFGILAGTFYRQMADPDEAAFSEKDAMQINRLLQRGKIDEAEDEVYTTLEECDAYDRF